MLAGSRLLAQGSWLMSKGVRSGRGTRASAGLIGVNVRKGSAEFGLNLNLCESFANGSNLWPLYPFEVSEVTS